ncbi:hypothetical protein [Sphingomonas baiyangensis]|uniref:Nutrient deprivation-induced protein n=1 Tax=Sphingomonas baiyangensis TaxID=2572576 RepID=A0A4U1L1C5_9SPHN|nr:hypothetical protein [Sphingomonas baiyangensis]TKD49950.1 hypothetical protein FBR43_03605 [Sphingomonas baiyangensis]
MTDQKSAVGDVSFEPAAPLEANAGDVTFDPAGGGSDGAGSASTSTRTAKETIKEEAGKLGSQAADRARSLAGDGKAKASGALGEFSKMMEDAAGTVDEKLGEQYGQYARSAAQSIGGFAQTLDQKDIDELLDDVRGFVRNSPAIAIGTAAALGFMLARVVKAGVDGDTTRDGTPRA